MSTTLRRDAELNRQRILAAAREGFARQGLGITLDEVARLAGVGVGTVYRRFPNKELLIDELFAERIDEVAEVAEVALREPDPWSGMRMFLEGAVSLFASDRGLRELILGSEHTSERVLRARARLEPLGNRLIERAQAVGALRADLQHGDLSLILMMLDAIADRARHVAPDVWRRMLEIVLDGLVVRRDAPSALRVPALAPDKIHNVMAEWRP